MPVIPIYTSDENGVPLNDLELYIDDVLVDGDLDYGETYNFPCGKPFKMTLRRNLWYGADENICHNNPNTGNNDVDTVVSGFSDAPFFCLVPPNPHTPNSYINVNVNGNVYSQSYNYYTPSVNTMLTDIATQINADTATTFWEAIVSRDCLRIRKTQYTATTYNGQVFSVQIHREFPATMIQTNLGATGNTASHPCYPPNIVPDNDEYQWRIRWREQYEDFSQTLTVDTDDQVPFEFENTLEFPCCTNWSVANNDGDGVLEAGEYNPMFIILATPAFEGAISNFYLVKHPCSNKVCAYEMTNIPYCLYEYNFNVTPNEKENVIKNGRNHCYTYHCADIYTVGLRVVRCTEQLIEALKHCGCGIKDLVDVDIIEDVSYQQVETDELNPDIFSLDIQRPPVCEQLCQNCNAYCKRYCFQETDTFNISYVWNYPCCNSDQNTATITITDNNNVIQTVTLTSGNTYSFNYQWLTTGLHEIIATVETCCGTFVYKYKYYIIPCKPYKLDFEWKTDCDCTVRGSNPEIRECDCVPVGEKIMFYPEYTVPDCGCPLVCKTITPDPINGDVFTEQTNGKQLSAANFSTYPTPPMSYSPDGLYLVSSLYSSPTLLSSFSLSAMEHLGNTGVGARFFIGGYKGLPFTRALFLYYFFQNNYNYPVISGATLSFNLWFRYQNIPDGAYPVWGKIPNFPFKYINVNGVNTSDVVQPYTSAYNVTFLGSSSQFNGTVSTPFVNPTLSTPNTNAPFSDPATPYYKVQVNFGAGSLDVSGIRLEMGLDSAIFLNRQYVVDILISDIDLVVNVPATPYERCFKEYTVRWYVNDNKVKDVLMTSPNYDLVDDRLEYTFDNKGCYDVKLEVENCAGACDIKKQVCVGDPVTLTKTDCYEWKITDCKRYKQCYITNPDGTGGLSPVNITELNIVTLPVNTDWVQLDPYTVYYDPREQKYFFHKSSATVIVEYDLLYNPSLPHTANLYAFEYPYIINMVNGERLWVCEKYKVVVEVFDIKGNLIEGYPYEYLYYEGHNVHISVPKDGIYKVKFRVYSLIPETENLNSQVLERLECEYEWYLIELCGLYKCYEELFHKLQCATDCECPDPKEIAKLRQELNLFMAFFNLLNISIEAEFSMYATMSSIIMDSQRITNANTIDEQLQALVKLCNKCGCPCKSEVTKPVHCTERILSANTTSYNIKRNGGCCGK